MDESVGNGRLLSFGALPAPLASRESDLAVLRLIRSRRVGPATYHRLVAEHGSAGAALEALPRIAAEAGVRDYAPCPASVAEAELAAGQRAGARLLVIGAPDYPALLAGIEDAPPVLWIRGNEACLSRPTVAVIGARNASSLGLRMATGLARTLAESGVTVVAGLARGIDTAAHRATLERGTVAVMAGGIDAIYPTENAALAESICETGCLLTEQPPGLQPVARHFPARNRIVSGLASAVVVIEAAHRSGSLITARVGLDQGREVMAVPGHPMDARAAGCNALIRDGATLVRNAEDVLAVLDGRGLGGIAPPLGVGLAAGREPRSRHGGPRGASQDSAGRSGAARAVPVDPAELQGRLMSLLGPSPVEEDALIRDLGLSAAQVAPVLLELELEGIVSRLPGGRVALV